MSEPWAYIAHKGDVWGGVCAADISKKSLRDFFSDFAADGYSIKTVFSRDEYNSELARMRVSAVTLHDAKGHPMTSKEEWVFRANHLLEYAALLDTKAEGFRRDATRYRQLSIEARIQAARSPQVSADD